MWRVALSLVMVGSSPGVRPGQAVYSQNRYGYAVNLCGRGGGGSKVWMISSCPNYLHADVSDGEDLSRHQQEVTGGQLVKMSLVSGTVDSDVTLECHLFKPPPLPTEEVSSMDGS